jgi:hypothetical protein
MIKTSALTDWLVEGVSADSALIPTGKHVDFFLADSSVVEPFDAGVQVFSAAAGLIVRLSLSAVCVLQFDLPETEAPRLRLPRTPADLAKELTYPPLIYAFNPERWAAFLSSIYPSRRAERLEPEMLAPLASSLVGSRSFEGWVAETGPVSDGTADYPVCRAFAYVAFGYPMAPPPPSPVGAP